MTEKKFWRLKGGNLDLDLCSADTISWKQDPCPWNVAIGTNDHQYAGTLLDWVVLTELTQSDVRFQSD